MDTHKTQSILLTGATGAVGGALLPKLLESGHTVKALVRNPAQASLGDIEVVEGDVLSGAGLGAALEGVDVAYYLIHSMGRSPGDFELNDRIGAENFARRRRVPACGGSSTSAGCLLPVVAQRTFRAALRLPRSSRPAFPNRSTPAPRW